MELDGFMTFGFAVMNDGVNHEAIVVIAKTQEDYQTWLKQQKQGNTEEAPLTKGEFTHEELMAEGKEVYQKNCAVCHKVDGSGVKGAFPGLKNSPIALGDVNKHIDVVVKGVSGTAMQGFSAQLNDLELAAVITYERNTWGNKPKTDKTVHPHQIKQARQNNK